MLRIVVTLILIVSILGCKREKAQLFFVASWGDVSVKNSKKNTPVSKPAKKHQGQAVKNKVKSSGKKKNVVKIPAKKSEKQMIVIAGSRPNTEKFNVAGNICNYLNQHPKSNFRCFVETTPSVKYSLQNAHKYDFIISQTNLDKKFQNKHNGLTSMFSLYPETFTLIVGKDSGINSISDLKGKKVYVSSDISSANLAFNKVLESVKIKPKNVEIKSGANASYRLCEGRIDAIFTDIRHPDVDIITFINHCGARLIPLQGKGIANLIKNYNEYIKAEIPGGVYTSYPQSIKSFGIMTNLIATSRVSDATAFEITKLIFDDLEKFKTSDPALLDLTPGQMTVMNQGLIFSIHAGARKYYKENSIKH